ncbi:gypsy type transposase [Tanacetum coccineum]
MIPFKVAAPRLSTVKLRCLGFDGGGDDVTQYVIESRKHWDNFYERHQNKFFKDRHYLEKDWGQYFCDEDDTPPTDGKIILEAGCGTGNTIFPIAKKYPQIFVHACDFSHHAITLVKSHTNFREDQMNVFVCNIAEDNLSDHIMPASVDIVTLVFTLSAVSLEKMPIVLQNIGRVLKVISDELLYMYGNLDKKPNGYVLLRDYAIGDYAQAMLMNKNRVISENFYFRGDGTCSFYFSEDLLSELFVTAGFTVVDVNTYNREIVNRAKNVTMQRWNDHFFWVDAFACPASFPWNTSKSVSNDPFPKSSEFNAEHYATLVAYPAPFHKYLEPFLCLVGISHNYTLDEDTYPQFLRENSEEIDLLSIIQTADPTKVRVGERQHAEDEPRLLDTTVGRVVPLLPIALARAKSELDASVDKLFDEGGNGNQAEQGDSASGGHGVGIRLVSKAAETVVEDAAPNAEVRGEPIPTLPFVTSSVSATPKREDEAHTASATGLNLRTIGAPPRFVISSDSSHHSGANIAEAEVDSFARPSVLLMIVATTVTSTVDPATTVKEKFVESSVFVGDSSGGGADHIAGGFSDLPGSDFIVGGIRTVISPDTDLQKVYVPQWSVTNASRLDDGRTCHEMVDEFAPPKFFASIHGMEHDQLFMKFNVGAACQMSLNAEVRMRVEYNIRERRRLNSVVEEKNSLLKTRDEEVKSLKTRLLVKEAEAAKAVHLRAEASKFEVVEEFLHDEVKVLKEQNATLEQEKTDLSVKVADLVASVKVREQEVADLDAQVTFAKSQSDNFADRVRTCALKLSPPHKYRCMNWRLPLLSFKSVNFSLIAELRANKDASIDTIMNHLRLEDTLAERLGRISLDDFEVTGADDQATTDGNVVDKDADPFPNVDEANIHQDREVAFLPVTNLYAPFPSASVTSYSPSHLGPSFPVSFARLASLLRYTRSPGLKLVFRTFALYYFSIFALLLASHIAASSLLSSKRSRLISKASLFCTRSTSAVLIVGMPISAGMTVSVLYVNENEVSPLLDFIIVRCAHRT